MNFKEIAEYTIDLKNRCLKETHDVGPNLNANIIVAKVRKFNREWNKKAEENQEMKKDGFNYFMKRLYKDFDDESVKAAIKYL